MSQKSSSIALIDLGCSADRRGQGRAVSPFRRVGRQTLLERTVRRLCESSLLDSIAIVGDNEFSGLIAQSCTQPAVWLPTDEPSCVARAWYAAQSLEAEWVVTVNATSVFVDPILIDRLLATAWGNPKSDMVAFMSMHKSGLCEQAAGLAGDACNRRVLKQMMRDPAVMNDSRGLSQLLVSMPEVFHTRLIPLPEVLEYTDLRFMLETERDLDRAQMILEATGEDCDYRDLVPLASHFDR
ncbi:MAG: NTP transferase domain-containing protein [Pirellulaceae bacterium]|nr:NTP transferase domain-containing protein [Pirellulaceae bacterium]